MKSKIIIFGDDPTGYTGFGKISDHLVNAVSGAGYTPIVVGLKTNKDKNYGKAKIYNTVALSDNQGWETLEKALTLDPEMASVKENLERLKIKTYKQPSCKTNLLPAL